MAAIEERDGVRFYVDRTSPLAPIRLDPHARLRRRVPLLRRGVVTDVLLVSLGGTAGLRAADEELAASLRRAGASVAVARVPRVREWRTMAAIELAWAMSARRATAARDRGALPARGDLLVDHGGAARAGAGAIRFDAPAAGNRPGRHGVWQRPVERRRLAAAPLLLPWSEGGLAEAPAPHADALVLPMPVEPSGEPARARHRRDHVRGQPGEEGARPRARGLASGASAPEDELVVAGLDEPAWRARRRAAGPVRRPDRRDEYRALLRRARVFVTAPRREDYGIAQLEALADGCVLVTTPAPGPYAALPLARALDPRLVADDLGAGAPGRARRRRARATPRAPPKLLRPCRRDAVDRVVASGLLPRLLG